MSKPSTKIFYSSSSSSQDRSSKLESLLRDEGYLPGNTLGSGAYAKVKEACHTKEKTMVALKIIDLIKAPENLMNKFLPRELDALRHIDHPNVIRMISSLQFSTQHLVIVTELAENGDLLDYINKHRRLSEDRSLDIFIDFINGMKYLHGRDIVHRDLKCENLLLDKNNKLMIADLGFVTREMGRLSTYCGSIAYVSPEVLRKQPYYGKPADVWSMGVILYAMLYGKLPFKESDLVSKGAKVMTGIDYTTRHLLSEYTILFLRQLLVYDPDGRLTVNQMLSHQWIVLKKVNQTSISSSESNGPNSEESLYLSRNRKPGSQ
ncbi:Testis-specific serine/threonine-protein kinase 1 [Oopsacas minuta]|uniref:Testis-specific serine/threonine-protein kinase 1 n=1 Tax=Oopsacas minuta TaxID=111878 RepID=A0AAV7K157_9METZ|nr:Testis-specific serine/threonine-protein kinase 1 [Oopsacas minuta]